MRRCFLPVAVAICISFGGLAPARAATCGGIGGINLVGSECQVTSSIDVFAGGSFIFDNSLHILSGGALNFGTSTSTLSIFGDLIIDDGGFLTANTDTLSGLPNQVAGTLNIDTTGSASIAGSLEARGRHLASSGGHINMDIDGDFEITSTGKVLATKERTGDFGVAGSIDIEAGGSATIASGGSISTVTHQKHSGPISLVADEDVQIDGTVDSSVSSPTNGAKGGSINIQSTSGQVEVGLTGVVKSAGDAGGKIDLAAQTDVNIDGQVLSTGTTFADGSHSDGISILAEIGGITVGDRAIIHGTAKGIDLISLNAKGDILINGQVLSTGLSSTGRGGPIAIVSEDGIVFVNDGAIIKSEGQDPGADKILLEACEIIIYGRVASIAKHDGGNVTLISGGDVTIDDIDHNGHLSADMSFGPGSGAVEVYAKGDVTVKGDAENKNRFAISANNPTTNQPGGNIRVVSTTESITLIGDVISASATNGGGDGGEVLIQAFKDLFGTDVTILAKGDSVPTYGDGGEIVIHAFNGSQFWSGANLIDVLPAGASVPLANQGTVTLLALALPDLSSVTFPTIGTQTNPIFIVSSGGTIDLAFEIKCCDGPDIDEEPPGGEVPEPATLGAMAAAFVGLIATRRRRRA